jgi:hypothetical protein
MLERMNTVSATFRIEPVGDWFHATVSADGKVWRKKYESWTDASSEAVELGTMEPSFKEFVDKAVRRETSGYAPSRTFEVDLDELRTRRFLLDS